jgi:hypothetical protein
MAPQDLLTLTGLEGMLEDRKHVDILGIVQFFFLKRKEF